jgi:hypothetical protein
MHMEHGLLRLHKNVRLLRLPTARTSQPCRTCSTDFERDGLTSSMRAGSWTACACAHMDKLVFYAQGNNEKLARGAQSETRGTNKLTVQDREGKGKRIHTKTILACDAPRWPGRGCYRLTNAEAMVGGFSGASRASSKGFLDVDLA